jgi:hypothetical protein
MNRSVRGAGKGTGAHLNANKRIFIVRVSRECVPPDKLGGAVCKSTRCSPGLGAASNEGRACDVASVARDASFARSLLCFIECSKRVARARVGSAGGRRWACKGAGSCTGREGTVDRGERFAHALVYLLLTGDTGRTDSKVGAGSDGAVLQKRRVRLRRLKTNTLAFPPTPRLTDDHTGSIDTR